jgi:hemoglobin/transferrin/lactoferrin receptor protein
MKKRLLVGLISVTTFAWAQQAQPEQADTLQQRYLDEVVVSANRWEQNIREISGRITKLSSKEIQFQNPQTSADLLGLTNQVFIQKSQLGGGSPIIRGFSTNRVMLVIDGVRMNNAIFRGGNVQNVISLDAHAIRETEVLFGPGSAMYGSDAIGGVMDFHTLRPELSSTGLKFTGNLLTRYSSANNERTGHIDFTIGSKKWAFLGSVTNSNFGDLRMGSMGPVEYTRPDYQIREGANDLVVKNPDPNVQVSSGYGQTNAMAKLTFRPNKNWDLTYAYHYSETSNVPRYDRLILKNTSGDFASAAWYYGPQRWTMHNASVKYQKDATLFNRARLTIAYQEYGESRHNRNFAGSNRNRMTERFENVGAWSANLDLEKQLADKWAVFYGAEFVQNSIGSRAHRRDIITQALSPVSTRYPNGSDWTSSAAYFSLRYNARKNLTVNASARYTNVYTYAPFDTTFFDFEFTEAKLRNSAVNGGIGAAIALKNDSKVFFNLSTGFRAPNIDDIGKVFDSQPGTVIVPNPNLRPEIAYNAELGYTGEITKGLYIDGAVYYTFLDNAIVRSAYRFSGRDSIDYDGTLSQVLALQNTSQLSVMGTQLAMMYNFFVRWQMRMSVNLQQGRERDPLTGETFSPTHVPPTFGAAQLSYRTRKWMAMVYTNFNGEIGAKDLALSERADAHLYAKDANGKPYAPAWVTWNVKASINPALFLTLDVGVENIFDVRYRPYASGITAPGRNFIVALRFKF